jgi:37-kD nucleoid-associated bacterial protein
MDNIMIEYTNTVIEKVSVQSIGNKTDGEGPLLSDSLLDISGDKVRELLAKFFLTPFSQPEYYSFTFSNYNFTLNPMFLFASQIFEDVKQFQKTSLDMVRYLYELPIQTQIKPGDIFITYFSEIVVEDEVTNAIGIFKSETRQSFLKLDCENNSYSIRCEDGINIEKLDKGCMIFNTDKESGYKICLVDKSNKNSEAQFWKDSFLQLKPYSDVYHYTKDLLNITKYYIAKELPDEFEINKTDQIDLLNRSAEYFKTHDIFDKADYAKEVFIDSKMIKSFRKFDESFRNENNIDSEDNFEISPSAVREGLKLFKSVLKLDKNFHIYIHGDIGLISQGKEKDGRKFYKIYYEKET